MRRAILKVLTTPVFVCGILWWHIRKAFDTGFEWEKIEMDKS